MHYLLGTDEAGYGPNLGPLVVAATLWRVHDRPDASPSQIMAADAGLSDAGLADLYVRLADAITSDPTDRIRLALADSKQLYSSGESLERLERGVHVALALLNRVPRSWQEIWCRCSPSHRCELPWHRTFDCLLPTSAALAAIERHVAAFQLASQHSGVELVDLRATILHPADFNDRCDHLLSKGAVLSSATLRLVREMLPACHDGPAHVVCDKHGGRNRYAPLVWEELAAHESHTCAGFPVETVHESRDQSLYRWQAAHPREIRFITRGERFLPAALASMTAKYLRELSMLAFNAFWAERVPNLRPTAGYPGDARRFWTAIEPAIRLARFTERELWRVR